MYLFNRLTAVVLTAALLGPMLPLEARTKKGDKFLAEGRVHEQKKEWDAALEAYEKALSEDPADILYQMAVRRRRASRPPRSTSTRASSSAPGATGRGAARIPEGLRDQSRLRRRRQEIRRTQEMIERERKRVEETGQGVRRPKSAR